MKRPLAVVGITMLVTLSALCLTDSTRLCVAVGAAAFVFAVFCLLAKKSKASSVAACILLTVGMSCLLVLSADTLLKKPAFESVCQRETVRLQITDYPTAKNGRFYYIARLKSADTAVKPLVRLSVSENREISASLEPGDEIEYTGNLYIIAEKNKPIHRYYQSRKILLGSYPTDEIRLVSEGRHGLLYWIKNLRRRTENLILKGFEGETAGLVISVLLGEKSFVSDETYSLFKTAGAAHIMAVSGLHLSIWILFVMRVVSFLGFDERKAASALLGLTLVIMAFASFSGSVMRAGLMMLLYLVGISSGRQGDALSSLGFSAVVVLFVNPYASMNISFLLSFASTLAMIVFALPLSAAVTGKINRRLKSERRKKISGAIVTSVLISLSVTLFTLPITALSFGSVSAVGFVTNLLLLPVITPFVVSSGLFVIFSAVPVLSDIIGLFVSFGAKYCLAVVGCLGSRSFSAYSFHRDTVWVWILLVCVFFAVLYFAIKKKKRGLYLTAAVLLAVSVPCAVLADAVYENTHATVTVFDVSDGLAVSVSCRNRAAVIVKGCDSYHADFVRRSLEEKNCPVEYAVVLGENDEAAALLNGLSAGRIITTDSDLSAFSSDNREKTVTGDTVFLEENCLIHVADGTAVIRLYGRRLVISDGFCEADVLISGNLQIPLEHNGKTDIIVSSDFSSERAYSTADYSDITLTVAKNGKITLKGENAWRYLMKSS